MKFIPNSTTQKVARQVLKIKKGSPRTMFVLGITGGIAGAVLACRATLKLEDALEYTENEIADLRTNRPHNPHYKKDLVYVYAKGTASIVKLYAPAIVVGSISVAALTGSHVTLTKRNAGLTAAYAAVATTLEEYRVRVREELGDEKELDIYRGVTLEEVINEEGKKVKIETVDPNKLSMYSKMFDDYNPNWTKNPEVNKIFLLAQQNVANDLLQVRGHMFLNEIYDALGMDHTSAGAVVGWVISPDGGDNYIDFGLHEARNSEFLNGWERSIILDFNVDGVILDKI